MTEFLPFIISGITAGAIYGLAGTGLVLTYKTSGVFNFGYGAMATIAAYVFFALHERGGVDWRIAAFVSVLVVGPLMGLIMEPFARQLSTQSVMYKVVGTIGIIVAVQGFGTLIYGVDTIPVDDFLPRGTESFELGGVYIQFSQVIIIGLSLAVMGGLFVLFRGTRMGLLMRAVVDDADLLNVQGVNPGRVRRIAWVLGGTLASLSGVMLLPIVGLDPIILTMLIIQAFGAAALGGFSSIPIAYAGGILIGVASDLSRKYVLNVEWLSGLPAGLPFLILFIVLLVLPKHKLVPPVSVERKLPLNYRAPGWVRAVTAVLVIAILASLPSFAGSKLGFFTMGASLMIVLLSLGLLVKTSGQVSLCHAAFMAMGVCMFSNLAVTHQWPWFPAFFVAALIVVPVGALIAIPAIRLSGLFLALATLGFGILVEQVVYPLDFMFTRVSAGRPIPRPSFAEGDVAFFYFVLAVAVVVGGLIMALNASRLGRLLRGMSDSPAAMTTFGLSTNVAKVIVFSISTFLAALGGILYGATFHFASSGDLRFEPMFSLMMLAILAIQPFREPWYVLPAAIGVALPAFWTIENSDYWVMAITGVFAIITALVGGPPVFTEAFKDKLDRVLRRKQGHSNDSTSSAYDRASEFGPCTIGRADRIGGSQSDGSLRWSCRSQQCLAERADQSHNRSDRSEWCRQDDDLQRLQRLQPAIRR